MMASMQCIYLLWRIMCKGTFFSMNACVTTQYLSPIHPLYCDHEWRFYTQIYRKKCIVVALMHDIFWTILHMFCSGIYLKHSLALTSSHFMLTVRQTSIRESARCGKGRECGFSMSFWLTDICLLCHISWEGTLNWVSLCQIKLI